jgi:hypothetical protein
MSLYDVNSQELGQVINTEIDKLVATAGADFGLENQEQVIKSAKGIRPVIVAKANESGYELGATSNLEEFTAARFSDINVGTTEIIAQAIKKAEADNPKTQEELTEKVLGYVEQEFYNPTLDSTNQLRQSIDFIQNLTNKPVDVKNYIYSDEGIGGWVKQQAANTPLAAAPAATPAPEAEAQQPAAQPETEAKTPPVAEATPEPKAETKPEPEPEPNPNRTRQAPEESQAEAAPEPTAQTPAETETPTQATPVADTSTDAPAADPLTSMGDMIKEYLQDPLAQLSSEDPKGKMILGGVGAMLSMPDETLRDHPMLGQLITTIESKNDPENPGTKLNAEKVATRALADVMQSQDKRPGKSDEIYLPVAEATYTTVREFFAETESQRILNNPNVTVEEIEELSRQAALRVKERLDNDPAFAEFTELNGMEQFLSGIFAGGKTPTEGLTGITADGTVADPTSNSLHTMLFASLSAQYVQSPEQQAKLKTYDVDTEARMAEERRKEKEDGEKTPLGARGDSFGDAFRNILGEDIPTAMAEFGQFLASLLAGIANFFTTAFEDNSDKVGKTEDYVTKDRGGDDTPDRSTTTPSRTRDSSDEFDLSSSAREQADEVRSSNTSVRGGIEDDNVAPPPARSRENDAGMATYKI